MASAPTMTAPVAAGDDYVGPGRSAWMDVDWRAHQRWLSFDGRAVNAIDIGQGPPVLLIHGLAGSWQNWLENVCPLSRSHRVIAMDLPGFGYSPMPRDKISMTAYAHCLDALCDQLEIEQAAVLGNSMGGFVGADMAIAHPERVSHLVLVAAAVLWNEQRRARPMATLANVAQAASALAATRWRKTATRPLPRALSLAQVVRYPFRIPAPLAIEQLRHVGSAEGFAASLEALYSYRLRDRLTEIDCPTLVVWGTHDQLVPIRHGRTMAELIPNARLEVFEQTGHVPMLERPARFNALVEEFLAN
jgi:pimeloyl-ACP methyl ester carboxylesterase